MNPWPQRQEILMRWLLACLLAGVVIAVGDGFARRSSRAELPGAAAATPGGRPEYELRGAGSCAAAACHNGNGPKGSKGSEYTTWVIHDPHARAVEVLYGKRSLQIEKKRKHSPEVDENHPERDPLCLNCHVRPGIEPYLTQTHKLPRGAAFSYEDGVSCEACHGAAGGWLTDHYTAEWRGKSAAQKEAEGMCNTKDLRLRAELCVRCHVGRGDIDVNHDLIAAGHPRLAFEFGAFLANMPKHWSEETDKAGRRDFEARAWAIGQAVSAKAALKLLAHRADVKNKRPWPEFAEYDCFACHHDLKAQNWRRERKERKELPGTLPWGSWYFPMLPDALGGEAPKELMDELSSLREAMQLFGPDQQDVMARAQSVSAKLRPWPEKLARQEHDRAALDKALKRIAADDRRVSEASWDGAAQLYLAIAAHDSARDDLDREKRDPVLKTRIQALGKQLSFPPLAPGQHYDSPAEDGPKRVQEALKRIQQALQK